MCSCHREFKRPEPNKNERELRIKNNDSQPGTNQQTNKQKQQQKTKNTERIHHQFASKEGWRFTSIHVSKQRPTPQCQCCCSCQSECQCSRQYANPWQCQTAKCRIPDSDDANWDGWIHQDFIRILIF